jgi:transcriptional regulator with XRE-family HTH domain
VAADFSLLLRPPPSIPGSASFFAVCATSAKLSQQAVANRAGITTGAYARTEKVADPPDKSGKPPPRTNPTWTTVIAISEAFDVTLVQLAELVEAEGADR